MVSQGRCIGVDRGQSKKYAMCGASRICGGMGAPNGRTNCRRWEESKCAQGVRKTVEVATGIACRWDVSALARNWLETLGLPWQGEVSEEARR